MRTLTGDLKPENILLDKNGHIKLTDFGLAKMVKDNDKAYTICGTVQYIAPEVLMNKGYKKEVDWWSLGCVIYEMLEGRSPFGKPKGRINISFYEKNLDFYYTDSKEAQNFIKELLVINPEKRLGYGKNGSEKVKSHPFFKGVDWNKVFKKEYKPPFVPELLDELDLKYFDKTFTEENVNLNSLNKGNESRDFGSDYADFSYIENDMNEDLMN